MRQKEKQRKKAEWLCLLLMGMLPEEARQWKWKEQTHTRIHTKAGLDGRGGRGNRQMLLIPVVGCWSEGGKIWVMGTESEMSTDWVRAELGPSGRREYQHWLRGMQDFRNLTGLMAKILDIVCVHAHLCVCVHVTWGRMWDWLSLLSIMNG